MYPGQLHLMLCGGQALASLKYENGDLSLLNIAQVEHWPQLTAAEVMLLAGHRYPYLKLSQQAASVLLEVSGGHPGLINLGLSESAQSGVFERQYYQQCFVQSDVLWQAFSQIATEDHARLAQLLEKDTVGNYRPFINDRLLSQLFWQNLIHMQTDDQSRQLAWRSGAVQQAGQGFIDQVLQA